MLCAVHGTFINFLLTLQPHSNIFVSKCPMHELLYKAIAFFFFFAVLKFNSISPPFFCLMTEGNKGIGRAKTMFVFGI